jgi:hypothetical protein
VNCIEKGEPSENVFFLSATYQSSSARYKLARTLKKEEGNTNATIQAKNEFLLFLLQCLFDAFHCCNAASFLLGRREFLKRTHIKAEGSRAESQHKHENLYYV